jgi:hypothetical protein
MFEIGSRQSDNLVEVQTIHVLILYSLLRGTGKEFRPSFLSSVLLQVANGDEKVADWKAWFAEQMARG